MTPDVQKNDSPRSPRQEQLPTQTSDRDRDERQERWSSTIEQAYCQLDFIPTRQTRHFDAELSVRPFGDLRLGTIQASPHEVWRRRNMVSSDARTDYLICLIAEGRASVEQGGRSAELARGSFALLDTGRVFRYRTPTDVEQLSIAIPRDQLNVRIPEQVLTGLTATTVSGDTGSGRLVSNILREIATMEPAGSTRSEPGLATSTLDMIATVLVGERTALSDRRVAQSQDLLRAQQQLERHLHDPDYTLSDIASDLSMSLRTLHKLFSVHGTTPGSWLWQVRLEHARQYLRTTDLTVAEVSERVGFRDVSHFSRSFRRRFAHSPGRFRAMTGDKPAEQE